MDYVKDKFAIIEKLSWLILQYKDTNRAAVEIMAWLEEQGLLNSNSENEPEDPADGRKCPEDVGYCSGCFRPTQKCECDYTRR